MKKAPIPVDEALRLDALRALDLNSQDSSRILQELTDLAAASCGVPMAAISLVEADQVRLVSKKGIADDSVPREIAFCPYTILADEPMVIQDTLADERFHDNPLVVGDPRIRFYAGLPLTLPTGYRIGTVCVFNTSPGDLSDSGRTVMGLIARQVILLLEHVANERDLAAARRQLEIASAEADLSHQIMLSINEVQQKFINHPSTKDAFELMLSLLLTFTHSEYGFLGEVLLRDDGTPYLKTHALTNIAWNEETQRFYDEHAPAGLEFTNLNTLFGRIMTDRKPIISNDPRKDPRRGGLPPGHPPLTAFLGVPVMMGDEMIGAFGVANRTDGYSDSEVEMLAPVMSTYANLIQARRDRLRREEVERKLKDSEETLQQVLSASGLGYWDWDIVSDEILFSRQCVAMLGYEIGQLEQSVETWWNLMFPGDRTRVQLLLRNYLDGRIDNYSFEHRLQSADGDWRWFQVEGGAVKRDEQGRPTQMSGILKDITDQKTIETQEQELLDSRTMMQEIHHRIKNNLQIVSSMLALQERKFKDPEVIEGFLVTRNRVATIGLLHELLYRSSRAETVNLRTLCMELTSQIKEGLGIQPSQIQIVVDVDDIVLGYDRSGPIALILNEIVTNSIKHAFPGGEKGLISISSRKSDDTKEIEIIISDNGIGMSEAGESHRTGSIGMKLVERLAAQLNASFERLSVAKGTAWKLSMGQ